MIAITQIAVKAGPGRVFYDRKRREGKTKKETPRALKRRLATVVYRCMLADPEAKKVSCRLFGKVTHQTHHKPA